MSTLDHSSESEQDADHFSLRESYISAIESIAPVSEQERMDIVKTIEWLKSSAFVHKPHNMNEHLGVMCFIVCEDTGNIFMLHHKKAETWLPPG